MVIMPVAARAAALHDLSARRRPLRHDAAQRAQLQAIGFIAGRIDVCVCTTTWPVMAKQARQDLTGRTSNDGQCQPS